MSTDDLIPVFKALADATRRQLLDRLRTGPATTGALADGFPLTRFAIMKHLSVLQAAGLVTVQRRGRERWNVLNPMPLQAVYDRWLGSYSAHWAKSLAALGRAALEAGQPDPTHPLEKQIEQETTMASSSIESPPIVDLKTLNLRLETHLSAPREKVYAALINDIGLWWGAPYLRDAERATDMVLDARPGGRLREIWGPSEGAVWGEVTRIGAPHLLELTGRMGMTGPVYAVVTFELAEVDGGTTVTLTHQAVGDVDDESEAGYRDGWGDLLENGLRPYVETGRASGVRTAPGGSESG